MLPNSHCVLTHSNCCHCSQSSAQVYIQCVTGAPIHKLTGVTVYPLVNMPLFHDINPDCLFDITTYQLLSLVNQSTVLQFRLSGTIPELLTEWHHLHIYTCTNNIIMIPCTLYV